MSIVIDSRKLIKFLVRSAIFGAIATILYVVPFFRFPLPIFLPFLDLRFDEVPAFIAGYAYGPLVSIVVLIIKTLIKLPFSSTFFVAEIADFTYGVILLLPATIIFRLMRNWKGVVIGLSVALVIELIFSLIFGIYVIFPFFCQLYGMDESSLLAMCQAINPAITDVKWSMGFFMVLPFNLLKNSIVIALTLLLYKSLSIIINKIHAQDGVGQEEYNDEYDEFEEIDDDDIENNNEE